MVQSPIMIPTQELIVMINQALHQRLMDQASLHQPQTKETTSSMMKVKLFKQIITQSVINLSTMKTIKIISKNPLIVMIITKTNMLTKITHLKLLNKIQLL